MFFWDKVYSDNSLFGNEVTILGYEQFRKYNAKNNAKRITELDCGHILEF